ncbi:MAG: hypothetical protein IPI34_13845 [bacterium]|nr:hypothetical protein [bacterium]
MVTRAIEKAAQRVEGHNFGIRKHLIEYDDVVNKQREVIYSLRREILLGEDISEIMRDDIAAVVEALLAEHTDPERANDDWNFDELEREFQSLFLTPLPVPRGDRLTVGHTALGEDMLEAALARYADKELRLTPEVTRQLERYVKLQVIDEHWKDHLNQLVMLRSGIGLRSYGQRDPLVEYKGESYKMFQELMANIERDSVRLFYRAELVTGPAPPPGPSRRACRRGTTRSATWLGGRGPGGRAGRRRRRRAGPRRRRRLRAPRAAAGAADLAQRSLPLRQRQEVQEVLRPARRTGDVRRPE